MIFSRSAQVVLVAAVLAFSLLAAGCGGSSKSDTETTSAQQWAGDLCSSLTTWQDSLTSIASSVQSSKITKSSLQDAVDQAKDATQKLADDVKGLGRPGTAAGDKAKSEVDALATQLQDDVDKVQDAVKNVSGAAGALVALSTVSSTVSTMLSQIKTTFTNLKGLDGKGQTEMKDAFANVGSCKKLSSGT